MRLGVRHFECRQPIIHVESADGKGRQFYALNIISVCGTDVTLFARRGVNFGNVIAGERKYCRLPAIGGVWVGGRSRRRPSLCYRLARLATS